MDSLTTLFRGWAETEPDSIIQLMNKDRIPVAALYLNQLRFEKLIVSTTNTDEKYYIYFSGIAIFFTYFNKLSKNNFRK